VATASPPPAESPATRTRAGADTGFEESGVGGQAVLYRGPGRGVPEQSGSPRTGRDRRPAFASSAARWVPVQLVILVVGGIAGDLPGNVLRMQANAG
jgi:hypothetical protein